ncbi:MAG: hypothetical protein HYY01_00075 [Chloroflexi bacterium]|nr:hypothetical protein [Chloroflexota bacterium]
MPNPVVHFEILGKDGKRLQEFFARSPSLPLRYAQGFRLRASAQSL